MYRDESRVWAWGRIPVDDVVCVRWGDVGARQGSEERRLCYNWTISCPLIKSEILTCQGCGKYPRDIKSLCHMTWNLTDCLRPSGALGRGAFILKIEGFS